MLSLKKTLPTTSHHHHHHHCPPATFTVGGDTLSLAVVMESQIIHQDNVQYVVCVVIPLSFHLYSCPSRHSECLQSHSELFAALRELKCTRLPCIRAQEAVITLIRIIQLLSDRLICGFIQVSAKHFPLSHRYFSFSAVYEWH